MLQINRQRIGDGEGKQYKPWETCIYFSFQNCYPRQDILTGLKKYRS